MTWNFGYIRATDREVDAELDSRVTTPNHKAATTQGKVVFIKIKGGNDIYCIICSGKYKCKTFSKEPSHVHIILTFHRYSSTRILISIAS